MLHLKDSHVQINIVGALSSSMSKFPAIQKIDLTHGTHYCRIYTHLCKGQNYFDLMTLPYRKFAAVMYFVKLIILICRSEMLGVSADNLTKVTIMVCVFMFKIQILCLVSGDNDGDDGMDE